MCYIEEVLKESWSDCSNKQKDGSGYKEWINESCKRNRYIRKIPLPFSISQKNSLMRKCINICSDNSIVENFVFI